MSYNDMNTILTQYTQQVVDKRVDKITTDKGLCTDTTAQGYANTAEQNAKSYVESYAVHDASIDTEKQVIEIEGNKVTFELVGTTLTISFSSN